jgi:hypothetical protein
LDLLKPSYASGYAKNASQSAHPNLWDGLVGAWMPSLGVTGETLRDVSGNGNHGTLTNMDAATDWVATSKGLALDFGGSPNYVNFSSIDLKLNPDAISFVFWFKGSDPRSVLRIQSLNQNSPYIVPIWGSTYRFIQSNNGLNGPSSPAALRDGKWHHCAAVYDRNKFYGYYLDGSVSNNTTSGYNQLLPTNFTSTQMFRWWNNNEYSVGKFASGSIYNRALSPTEIKQLYVDSLAPFRTKKRTVVRVPAAIPAATVVGSIKKPTTIIKPSYQAGYARNASESENPKLWDGLVSWVPSLGSSGSTVRCIQDKSRGIKNNGITFSGSSEQSLSNGAFLSFDGSDDYMRIYDSSLKNFGYTNPDECLAIRFRRRSLTGTTALFGYLSAQFLGAYGRGFYFDGTTMHCMSETNNNNPTITSTVDDNKWHVAIANFGANGSFYLDGKLIGSGNLNSSWFYWLQLASASANPTPPSNAANASVDVSVAYQWDRLLTAGEIKKISVDSLAPFRKKQRLTVAVPAAVPTPSATYHPLRSLAHPLEQ